MGQLVELIRSGRDCVVIDSKTNEDITKLILVQIILEEEKSGKNLLPVEFLYQLIRNREESFHDFFYNYMTASFEAYLKARSEFERRFKSWLRTSCSADVGKDLSDARSCPATVGNQGRRLSHLRTTAAMFSPPPDAHSTRISPSLTRLVCTASCSTIGIQAEPV